MTRVLVTGAFDVMHLGHIRMLEFAKKQGDILFVLIDSDAKIKREKGPTRPFNNERDREEFLLSIKHVDNVFSFDSKEKLEDLCEIYLPDIRVVGGDWKDKEIVGNKSCKKIVYFDRIDGYSTTRILNEQ
tara:strand:- start:284 stop:673 length:390 start_codon:yes stop_codon:yes gene_type:complete